MMVMTLVITYKWIMVMTVMSKKRQIIIMKMMLSVMMITSDN